MSLTSIGVIRVELRRFEALSQRHSSGAPDHRDADRKCPRLKQGQERQWGGQWRREAQSVLSITCMFSI
jgi:hypothetical protein